MNLLQSVIVVVVLAALAYVAEAFLPSPFGLVAAILLGIGALVVIVRLLLALAGGGPRV